MISGLALKMSGRHQIDSILLSPKHFRLLQDPHRPGVMIKMHRNMTSIRSIRSPPIIRRYMARIRHHNHLTIAPASRRFVAIHADLDLDNIIPDFRGVEGSMAEGFDVGTGVGGEMGAGAGPDDTGRGEGAVEHGGVGAVGWDE